MHAGLPAELGLDGKEAQAVRLDAAITAALAHRLVDENALGRLRRLPATALSPEIRSAVLVVHENRRPGCVAQEPLGFLEAVTVPRVDACELRRLVAQNERFLDPFGFERTDQFRNRHRAVDFLRSSHRDHAVVENLEGDVRARGDRLANRQSSRMKERAVAQVLEQVGHVGERRHPDPLDPFAAHVGDPDRGSIHHHRHRVTADPGTGDGALDSPISVSRCEGLLSGRCGVGPWGDAPTLAHRTAGWCRLPLCISSLGRTPHQVACGTPSRAFALMTNAATPPDRLPMTNVNMIQKLNWYTAPMKNHFARRLISGRPPGGGTS